jgi:hypothetical protein
VVEGELGVAVDLGLALDIGDAARRQHHALDHQPGRHRRQRRETKNDGGERADRS